MSSIDVLLGHMVLWVVCLAGASIIASLTVALVVWLWREIRG